MNAGNMRKQGSPLSISGQRENIHGKGPTDDKILNVNSAI